MKRTLSETQPLDLMISSRCRDEVSFEEKAQSLAVVRRALKRRLEAIRLGGRQVFRVWIHEDESNSSSILQNWEKCLQKARDADVFLVLYNGRAGWLGSRDAVKGGVGICHAELEEAYNKAPTKVRTIQFVPAVPAQPGSTDEAFQDYFARLNLPGAQVATGEEALERAEELAAAIVLGLAREGVGLNSTGSYYAGEALEWSRQNFHRRRELMTSAVAGLLRLRGEKLPKSAPPGLAVVPIRDTRVGFVCDSIPASMSTAAARELVGQPFLRDHVHSQAWEANIAGPVHVIACQKSVTESQALRQLGFPDAVVVSAPFGVYVADEVQKIQMAFIANCRDETTTKKGVQDFLNWLNDQGEVKYLVGRARQRRQLADFLGGLSAAPSPAQGTR